MKLAVSINLAAFVPCIFEQFCLALIFNSTLAERLFQPRIKPTWMNAQHSAHDTDCESRAMLFDKGVLHFASLAKYTVAFLRNSHVSLLGQFL